MTNEVTTKSVLSLCDYTGNMVEPWLRAGYECWIVDIKHRSGIHRDKKNPLLVRVGCKIENFLPPSLNYAAAFAFPVCTDLTNSGNAHKRAKGLLAFADAVQLFGRCLQILEWTDAPYALENPVGSVSSINTYCSMKPDHTFDPCDFGGYLDYPGDAYTKKTCLWTGGGLVMPEKRPIEPVNVCSQGSFLQKLGGKSEKTKAIRSATPKGFAKAIFEANQ